MQRCDPDVTVALMADPNFHEVAWAARKPDESPVDPVRAGASWYHDDSTRVFSVTVDPYDSNIVYAGAASDAGVLKSTNGGSSFTPKNNGLLGARSSRTGSIQVDLKHPNVLYVGTEDNGVFKSYNGAETWFRINAGLDDQGVFGLAMAPGTPNILYAATFSSVYKKTTSK